MTPSLPQRGRLPKGCDPLTPHQLFHYEKFPFNLLIDYRYRGDAHAAGAEALCAGAPKSVCTLFFDPDRARELLGIFSPMKLKG